MRVSDREALKLKPDMGKAHNNFAARYASMKMWDPFIAPLAKLCLKPDLAWASQ